MRCILAQQGCCIQGFLAAGHVCTVTGYGAYHELAKQYAVPIVVTGFEPVDILEGLLICARLIQTEQALVVNQYTRSVREEGNRHALSIVNEVFEVNDAHWRGIGLIPQSGLRLSAAYRSFDAGYRFGMSFCGQPSPSLCQAGRVLLGQIKPRDCPYFGRLCSPDHPLGAPMVSGEGACAAYFHLRHHSLESAP
jgi:hydrogenase expression/formation protein HypD